MTPLDSRAVGFGLRRAILDATLALPEHTIDFVECAPENWIGLGGRYRDKLDRVRSRYPLTCHGLSLSLGGIRPLDKEFLRDLGSFLETYDVSLYSEHLSYCSDDSMLFDLLPIPFTEEAVEHVSARIRQVQDSLGRRIAVENVSYYAPHPVDHSLGEIEFIQAVVDRADCDILLDVNNLVVNAANHRTPKIALIDMLSSDRVTSYHVAGHFDADAGLKIDSHGAPVIDEVWDLLDYAYRHLGHKPTVLERDFHFDDFDALKLELKHLRTIQSQ